MQHRSDNTRSAAFSLPTDRRSFLKSGALTLGGMAAASALPGMALATPARKKSVIFVYLAGGLSQLDSYDMKPNAPAEIRGEFRPIASRVPGMLFCEHLPLHAKIADKLAIVHGVETIDSHGDAVISTGFHASERRPSIFDGWPTSPSSGCCGPVSGKPTQRRREDVDAHVRQSLRWAESGVPAIKLILDGRCLPHGDWDTHGKVLSRELNAFDELRAKLPVYDRVIYDLVSGIHERGLDRDVMIVACGELGRTPWINRHGGRDHWAPSGSVLVAGGGLRTGQIIGQTDRIGERSTTKPYTAQNVLATVYRHLDIDPTRMIPLADGRQSPLLNDATAIEELV